ncbi:unnamed protein product [Lactuca saligna]|uniref:Uncharacterized protein n=1 Tax=Lactuca saligna TaxID=75948 RepID=A0AA35YD96_LACSI|nr:unnamed protein product [Lactuca saligna]
MLNLAQALSRNREIKESIDASNLQSPNRIRYPIYGDMQDWNYIFVDCFEPTLEISANSARDTSTHGGFSVPWNAAEKVFPPLNFSQQTPAQELIVRDYMTMNGNLDIFCDFVENIEEVKSDKLKKIGKS